MNNNWANELLNEFSTREIMDAHFPMLTRFGLSDIDVAIHSHMLSYLASIGQHLGFSGIVECPIPVPTGTRLATLGDVRSDVVWFEKLNNHPIAIFEFERFQTRGDETKLRHKIENLAISAWRAGPSLRQCFLIYWLRSGVAPREIREARSPYQIGFIRNGVRVQPPNTPLMILKCVFGRKGDGLIISDLIIVSQNSQSWNV